MKNSDSSCIVCFRQVKGGFPSHDKCANKIRCVCGHLVNKSHIVDTKKTMKSKVGRVYSSCKFCDCAQIQVE